MSPRWWLLALAWLVCAGSLVWYRPGNDLDASIPTDGALGTQARFFQSQSATRVLALEVGGDIQTASAFLHELVQELQPLGARPLPVPDASASARMANRIHDLLPVLSNDADLERARAAMQPAALEQRLRGLAVWLRRPGNDLAAAAVFRDLLGFAEPVWMAARSLGAGVAGDAEHHGPWLQHADGHHLLAVLQVDFAPAEAERSAALVERALAAQETAAQHGLELRVVGAYRHFVDNNSTVFNDLIRTVPLSIAAIALLLVACFRSLRALVALHLPGIAAALGGMAGAVWWYGGTVPMTVLGFVPAVLGIAVDYGIHMTRAAQEGEPQRVRAPLWLGWATATAAFGMLMGSRFPVLAGVGAVVVAGLAMALLTTLVAVPAVVRPRPQAATWLRVGNWAYALGHRRPRWALAAAIAITAVMVPGLMRSHLADDLRQLDGSSAATVADLDAVADRWGRLGGSDFLAASGPDTGTALDRLAAASARVGSEASLLRLVPGPRLAAERQAAWNAFWESEAATFAANLETAARAAGLNAAPFGPSRERYRPTQGAITINPATWADTPLGPLIGTLIDARANGVRAIQPLHLPTDDALMAAQRAVDGTPDIFLASRRLLAAALVDDLAADLTARLLWMTAAMVLVLALWLRSVRQGLAVIATPLLGLAWSFGSLGWLGQAITPLHLLIIAFVCGVGIDDAVFYRRIADRRASITPMLATTVTSCAGVGALCFGSHPVISQVGLAVVLAMISCLIACLLTVPALAGSRGHNLQDVARP